MQLHSFCCEHGGLVIRGSFCVPRDDLSQRYPTVFLSHGFGGTGDGMEPYAALFQSMGYAAFWFDFCGGSLGSRSDGRPEDMTLQSECDDLRAVIAHALTQPFVDAGHLCLLGESMGGLISALVAAQDPDSIEALVLLCPALCIPDDARAGHLGGGSYDPEQVPELIVCSNGMRLSRAFHEEAARMDVMQAIRAYPGRVLIHHGMADLTVPFAYALRARQAYGEGCVLHLVQNVGHGLTQQQRKSALSTIRLFLLGQKEVLHVEVLLTSAEAGEPDENGLWTNDVYFTGYAWGDWFHGSILPGAVDHQTFRADQCLTLHADYTLMGLDPDGLRCHVHIINQNRDGEWRPTVETDSPALAWLEKAPLTAVLEHRPKGLSVCIYA